MLGIVCAVGREVRDGGDDGSGEDEGIEDGFFGRRK